MSITVIVRSEEGSDARLTFDGMQRVVIGRGAGSDVRLPDAGVSQRHACLVAKGADFLLIDEGSTNGTFVGDVRVAPHTSRIVRSGDSVRVGRVWLELRVDQSPVTRDVAGATRELALALVSRAMAARGEDSTVRVRVVEGADQGAVLPLGVEGRTYVLGRGPECDLSLADADASRTHAQVERRGSAVVVRDLGAKNGTWIGEGRVAANGEALWRPAQMMRIGRTVLSLVEPVSDALADIEDGPDEELPVGAREVGRPASEAELPSSSADRGALGERGPASSAPVVEPPGRASVRPKRTGFSIADIVVMAAAVGVLALSIAGLLWLLRG
ncbi:MAG: FHA domain-containing protein [Polyangiaceae bacterium]